MGEDERSSPLEEVKGLFGRAESQTAEAMEVLVRREGFGELLARVTENTMAITRTSQGVYDLVLRNFRVAGREDITRLARQLARTEDKLERLLQEVERLGDLLEADAARRRSNRSGSGRNAESASRRSSNGRSRSSSAASPRSKPNAE